MSAKPRAHDRAGHAQHLAHSGTAFRPFVANHHHIAGLDVAVGDGVHGVFFAFENARRAAMAFPLDPGHLDHAAFRRKDCLAGSPGRRAS